MRTRHSEWLGGLVLVLASAILFAAFWAFLQTPDAEGAIGPAIDPVVVVVEEAPTERVSSLEIEVTLAPALSIPAPAWEGTVTQVPISEGSVIRSGDIIAVIDQVERLAVRIDTPFHRFLTLGDTGPDVLTLNEFLVDQNYLEEPREKYDWQVRSAVRKLAADLSVPDAAKVDTFDPAWVVYLPSDPFRVASVELRVGAPAPASGTIVALSQPEFLVAHVLPLVGYSSSLQVSDITINGATLPVLDDGTLELSEQSRTALINTLRTTSGVPTGESTTGSIRLSATGTIVYPEDLLAIPTTALVTVPDSGAQCVVSKRNGTFSGVAVQVVASEAATSQSFVRGLHSQEEIVAAPIAAEMRAYCEMGGRAAK